MKMIKLTKIGLLFSAVFLCAGICNAAPKNNGIAISAIVNDDIITNFDISSRIRMTLMTSRIPVTPENLNRVAKFELNNLIDDKLKRQEAKRLEITASDEEVAKAIETIEAQNHLPAGALKKISMDSGLGENAFNEQIKAQVLWLKTIRNLSAKQIFISDEVINDELARIEKTLSKTQYLLFEIFLPYSMAENQETLENTALEIVKTARENNNFSALAAQFSQSPSAAKGGAMGAISEDEIVKTLQSIVKNMNKGDISNPVKTEDGIYILYLSDKKDPQPVKKDYEYGMSQISVPLDADAKEIANKASSNKSCDAFNKFANELGYKNSGDIGKIMQSAIPEGIKNAISTLEIGQISTPIKTADANLLIMLCSKEEMSSLPNKNLIRSKLESQKAEAFASKTLRELRRNAIIEIRQ